MASPFVGWGRGATKFRCTGAQGARRARLPSSAAISEPFSLEFVEGVYDSLFSINACQVGQSCYQDLQPHIKYLLKTLKFVDLLTAISRTHVTTRVNQFIYKFLVSIVAST